VDAITAALAARVTRAQRRGPRPIVAPLPLNPRRRPARCLPAAQAFARVLFSSLPLKPKSVMNLRISAFLLMSSILVGCAAPPQLPVAVRSEALAAKPRIGVAMTALPKTDTAFPGADCLLCLAAASVANSSLTSHVQTLKTDDVAPVKADVAELLRAKGLDVVVIDEAIDLKTLPAVSSVQQNFARQDFTSLKAKYKVEKLLLIDVTAIGVHRTYASYIPTSDPKAVVRGASYIVDLSTNAYDWYLPLSVQKASESKWDEPPKFPGLTNAYYQAIETGKDAIVKPFSQ